MTAEPPAEQPQDTSYNPAPGDIFPSTGEAMADETNTPPAESPDYTITWDMPDTSKEKLGLAIAGGLAFFAPFVGFAIAANVARKNSGFIMPIGAGGLAFFAMRAAAVGVLHVTGNLPAVSAPAALGAVLPQIPRRNYSYPQARVFRGSPCKNCH